MNQLTCTFHLQEEIHLMPDIHGISHYDHRSVTECNPQILILKNPIISGKQVLCNVDFIFEFIFQTK